MKGRGSVPGRLVVLEPKDKRGTAYAISGVIGIGREPDNTIPIADDTYLSGHHAKVSAADGRVIVDDLALAQRHLPQRCSHHRAAHRQGRRPDPNRLHGVRGPMIAAIDHDRHVDEDALMATLRWGAATHEGQLRTQNEDNHHAGEGLFVVADGMGGHLAGEVASEMAVARLDERLPAGRLGYARRPRGGDQRGQRRDLQRLAAQSRPGRHGHHDHRDRGRRRSARRRGAGRRQRRRLARLRAAARTAAPGHRRPQLRAGARRRRARSRPPRRATTRAATSSRGRSASSRTSASTRGRCRSSAATGSCCAATASSTKSTDDVIQDDPRHAPRRPDGRRPGAGRRRQCIRRARQHHGDRGRRARGRRPARPDRGVRRHPGVERRGRRRRDRRGPSEIVTDPLDDEPPTTSSCRWRPRSRSTVDTPAAAPDLADGAGGRGCRRAPADTPKPEKMRRRRSGRLGRMLLALGAAAVLVLGFAILAAWARSGYYVAFDEDGTVAIYQGRERGSVVRADARGQEQPDS